MFLTTTSLNLDVWQMKNVHVKANQGEVNSRFLEITLTDKSVPLNLTDKTVVFYTTKPDGNVTYNLCTIEDASAGVISVCLTSQMSAVAGKMPCEIHLIDNDRSTLKAVGLELEIVKCADVEGAVESTSEFTALETAMAEYDEASDTINAHVANKNNPHEVTTTQIGAAEADHTHSTSDILSGTLPIARGGTNATTASDALSNLGGVPTTRTINSKALSSNITLNASDVGASESTHSHGMSDITSGILPVTKGGTGATTALDALTALGGKASSDFVMGVIVGNGQESKVTTLSFTPKFFIVYLLNYPPIKYDYTNDYYLYSFAMGGNAYGCTKGLSISGANVTLKQTQSAPSDGVFLNLNKNYGQYIYFAIKS